MESASVTAITTNQNSSSRRCRHSAAASSATSTTVTADPHARAPLPQLDALRRQQQRILHRSALIDYVLAAEKRGGEPLTMDDELAELLADITEAARTLLQPATRRR